MTTQTKKVVRRTLLRTCITAVTALVAVLAIAGLSVYFSRDTSEEVFVGMGGVGQPIDAASVGQMIQRWQMEGGREVTPEVFWTTYPASSAAVIPIPNGFGVDLLHLNDPGEGHSIVYFQTRASLPLALALNYRRVDWHFRTGILTLTAQDRNWGPTYIIAIVSGVICALVTDWLIGKVHKKD